MKVLCILTNGFEEIEAIGSIAILRRGGIDLDIFSLHNTTSIGRYGVTIANLNDIKNLQLDKYEALLIPGGPQYAELEANKYFLNIIKEFNNQQKLIAAICAGPTILGHLGLLKNKQYTCFTSMNEDFGGEYINTYAVKSGNIITGISAAATIDFAFMFLEALTSKEHAEQIKNQIYYYSK